MSRKYDPTKARRHWVYAREELCAMYSVSDGTITNWIRIGLEPIDSRRPQLFAGYKLRQFLTNMRWPGGRPPQNGRLFCSICLGFKALVAETIQTPSADTTCLSVTGLCTDCHNMLQAEIKSGDLAEIFAASRNTPEDSSDVNDVGGLGALVETGPQSSRKPTVRICA